MKPIDAPTPIEETPDAGIVCLQAHLDRAPHLNLAALRAAGQALVDGGHAIRMSFVETRDEPDSPHLDMAFEAFNASECWLVLERRLLGSMELGEALRSCSVTIRTGVQGWDDYKLLAHFDPAETLDPT